AGRRGSTRPPWEAADEPLADGNWPLLSASALPYKPGLQVPREMNGADFDDVTSAYVRAATMAAGAGFDAIELNFAHGYLLGSFLSPLTNTRTDEHGGALANRSRLPLRVFDAIKAAVTHVPLLVRIAASDWAPGGITHAESLELARLLAQHGCDMLIVSTGRTTSTAQPPQGRAFQTPFSDRLRNEAHIPTMAIGNITTADEINSILVAGRADLCALGRPHVRDPYWTLHAVSDDETRLNALLPREYREPKLS
ncbi:MAG: salicylyl-CoA 5-hydroxylase, partial [Myxococcaceae bacterium]|nr:salicylyl-CoA 5-hydroxylase [Myxococcaceae bacterium]